MSSIAGPIAYPRRMTEDRGDVFDGVRIGRPATGALIDAGYRALADLPADLDGLLSLHGVGPKAVRLLRQAQAEQAG
jgi:endonuclease III